MKWVTTSWTYSTFNLSFPLFLSFERSNISLSHPISISLILSVLHLCVYISLSISLSLSNSLYVCLSPSVDYLIDEGGVND